MEHAPDRAQLLHVLGRGAPLRQQRIEIVDFLGEFLEEDLADLLVDLLAHRLEAAGKRLAGRHHVRSHGGSGRTGRGFPGGRRWRLDHRRARARDRAGRAWLRHRPVRPGLTRADARLRRRRGGDDRRGLHGRAHRLGLGRQRPVAQRLQARAGDVEDLVAVAALFAQRLEVVLQAGQGIGQRVELAPIGHALARDQFALGVAADREQVIGRQRQLHHPQRASDLVEQARHVAELFVLPAGFDEGHQRLAGLHEVGDRLAHDGIDHLPRLAGEQLAAGGVAGRLGGTEPGDLVVQRGVDVEQRAGHVQQGVLVGRHSAIEDGQHRVALLLHHLARHAQSQHAQGIGHATKGFGVRLQAGQVVGPGAQVQVQRVLHVQQVVLDRGRDRVEQGAVATADAALRMLEFGLRRQRGVEFEYPPQFLERGMPAVGGMGDVVEQLPGRLLRAFAGRFGVAIVVQQGAARFALDAHEHLAQRGGRLQRAVGQRMGDRRGHPQHALHGQLPGAPHQRIHRRDQRAEGRARRVFLPPAEFALERLQQGRDRIAGGCLASGERVGKRTFEVGREQHALAEYAVATAGAQLVEQRQQHDRDVAMPALQALEVVGQQDDAAQQRRARRIAVDDGAGMQRERHLLHLLGDHRRRIQFHHAQRALHLVQVAGAQPHAAEIGRVFDVVLQFGLGQPQGFVELGLDPAQGGVFEGLAQRSHCIPPRLPAWLGLRPVVVAFIRCPGSVLRPAA